MSQRFRSLVSQLNLLPACRAIIEIKSGKDTLARLPEQRERYGARFDRLCLVIDKRHEPEEREAACVIKFGAVRVFESGALRSGGLSVQGHLIGWGYAPWEAQPAWHREHSARLSPPAMLSMLWAHEAEALAADLVASGAVPPTQLASRCRLIPYLGEHASIAQLRSRSAAALRARRLNRWEEAFRAKFDALRVETAVAA